MADDLALGAGDHDASAAWKHVSAGTATQAGVAETEQEQVAPGVTERGTASSKAQGCSSGFRESSLVMSLIRACLSLSPLPFPPFK